MLLTPPLGSLISRFYQKHNPMHIKLARGTLHFHAACDIAPDTFVQAELAPLFLYMLFNTWKTWNSHFEAQAFFTTKNKLAYQPNSQYNNRSFL